MLDPKWRRRPTATDVIQSDWVERIVLCAAAAAGDYGH